MECYLINDAVYGVSEMTPETAAYKYEWATSEMFSDSDSPDASSHDSILFKLKMMLCFEAVEYVERHQLYEYGLSWPPTRKHWHWNGKNYYTISQYSTRWMKKTVAMGKHTVYTDAYWQEP